MEHRLDKAFPRHQSGRFKNLKNLSSAVLQLILFVTPWVNWNGRPIVLLDLPGRKLHLFEWTFWPQDIHFVFILLMMACLTLFFVTALWGRIWCGYACPQTLFSHSFILVERLIEGDRHKRMKLERGPWHSEKTWKMLLKWSIWFVMSVFLGITFAGYYTPIRPLFTNFLTGNVESGTLLFVGFLTAVSLFFFGFLRGRFCSTVCPYARFQGAMFDRDTVMVNYDFKRGEPRGKVKDKDAADCVDCTLCVQVCPQNIDIRNGVQFECINCGACADACDTVMLKVDRPLGLIRYASEAEIEGGKTQYFRGRPLANAVALVALLVVFATLFFGRNPLEFDVVRADSEGVSATTADGRVSNRYKVRLINKQHPSMEVELGLDGFEGAELIAPVNPVPVAAESSEVIQVFVLVDGEKVPAVKHFHFVATDRADPTQKRQVKSTFIRARL